MGESKVKRKDFLKIISSNAETVSKWEPWKQKLIISAESAKTGKFWEEL